MDGRNDSSRQPILLPSGLYSVRLRG